MMLLTTIHIKMYIIIERINVNLKRGRSSNIESEDILESPPIKRRLPTASNEVTSVKVFAVIANALISKKT